MRRLLMKALQVVELFAGLRPDGQPIVEKLPVRELDNGDLQLVRSPAFVKGLASGDNIRCSADRREIEIIQHSGNLSVRVFSRQDISALRSEEHTSELQSRE